MTFFYLLLGGWGDRLELRANHDHMGWKDREGDDHGEPSIARRLDITKKLGKFSREYSKTSREFLLQNFVVKSRASFYYTHAKIYLVLLLYRAFLRYFFQK